MQIRSLMIAAVAASLFAAGVAAAQDDAPASLAIGAAAPMRDGKMKSVDGKDITLASAAGKKGTLVVFTCNHCPWAQAWQGRIAEIGNAARKSGLGVVAINSNDPAAYPDDDYASMQARAKKLNLRFPYVVDATSGVARAFGASHTPEAYLFDANGKLVYHGAIDDNAHDAAAVREHYLRHAVDAVVAGKSVPMAETKALGCSIKFRGDS